MQLGGQVRSNRQTVADEKRSYSTYTALYSLTEWVSFQTGRTSIVSFCPTVILGFTTCILSQEYSSVKYQIFISY